ncbi:MAG: serine hydrolase [bacterium]
MRNKYFIMTFFCVIIGCSLFAQIPEEYKDELKKFEKFVNTQMQRDQIPGLSIGFYFGETEWSRGFGFADLENNIPATAHSSYRLASNTKSMVAVAILQLAEQEKLSLDDNVRKHVPYFPRKKWPVTIRQVLGHLGGISHYKNYDIEGHIKVHKDTRESLDIFDDFDLVSEPGTEYHYSSYGYNLLGAVIEAAAKQPFGEYMQEHLWDPLRMQETYMDEPQKIIPNRVEGYRLEYGTVKNSEFVDISSRFAAGGTRSTVLDLLKYARGLEECKVISQESTDLMETSMATTDGHYTDYGMGWRINPVNGHFLAYHTGGQPETRTLLLRFPTQHMAIALAYNLEGGNLYAYGHRLYQLLRGEAWNQKIYAPGKEISTVIQGLQDIFNYGMSYVDRHKKPISNNIDTLKAAFSYLYDVFQKDSLYNNFGSTSKKIKEGRHLIADQAFVKVGSYMAEVLQDHYGKEKLEIYHKQGALKFFKDYMTLCTLPEYSERLLTLPSYLQNNLDKWNEAWTETWNNYTRSLYIISQDDLEKTAKKLHYLFSGKSIYPDYSEELGEIAFYKTVHSKSDEGEKILKTAEKMYPESAIPLVYQAHIQAILGNQQNAEELYKNSQQKTLHTEAAESNNLTRAARYLVSQNKLDMALTMLNILTKLYPEDGEITAEIGDIYLEKSRRAFEQALIKDPTLKHPWDQLKKIED